MQEKDFPSSDQVSEASWAKTPTSVQSLVESLLLRIGSLEKQFEELNEENEQLRAENALLKEQLQRNSENSSQPPSQDPVKEKKTLSQREGKRQRGGQPGHVGRGQKLYPAEACEQIVDYYPQTCAHCGERLKGDDPAPHRVQQIELPPLAPLVIEHRFHALSCECFNRLTRGWDEAVMNNGVYGERLSALVGWLSSVGHQSHHQVQGLLSEVFEIEISTGSVNRLRREFSDSLSDIVTTAGEYVQSQAVVNMDETGFRQGNADGHNQQQQQGWLWVVVTPLVSYFAVFLSRSQTVAKAMLTSEFSGIVGSDRCGAYSWLANTQRQVCWAHLKRDFTKIAERSGRSADLGEALLKQQKLLFTAWYQIRDGTLSRDNFIEQVQPIWDAVKRLLSEGAAYEITKGEKTPLAKTVGTCKKMLTVEPAFWTFVDCQGVEPTNNAAERALRPAGKCQD